LHTTSHQPSSVSAGTSKPLGRLFKIAVSAGIAPAVKLHIARGDDLEGRDEKGFTPLMIAASRSRAKICELLLTAGADVLALDPAGRDALVIARECGAEDAAAVIAEYLERRIVGQRATSDATPVIETLAAITSGLTVCATSSASSESQTGAVGSSQEVPHAASSVSTDECDDVPIATASTPESVKFIQRSVDTRHERAEATPPLFSTSTHNAANPAPSGSDEEFSSAVREVTQYLELSTKQDDNGEGSGERLRCASLPDGGSLATCEPIREPDIGLEASDDNLTDLVELTFGDWEAVEIAEPPSDDPHFAHIEEQRQLSMDSFRPVEDRAIWDEVDVSLPQVAIPLPQAENQDFRQSIRKLFLRALREGSIPRAAIEHAMEGQGEEQDLRYSTGFELALGAMGADIDNRTEFASGTFGDCSESFVDPLETESEEAAVDEALLYFDEWLACKNDSLRLYQREAVRPPLLSGEEEIELAQKMEDAVARALDSLALWPMGLRNLLDRVESEGGNGLSRIITTVSNSSDDGQEPDDSDSDIDTNERQDSEPDTEEGAEHFLESMGDDGTSVIDNPINVFCRIRELVDASCNDSMAPALRGELGCLHFRRPFLIELAGVARVDTHPASMTYRRAIADLIAARDHMVQANLRLVMSTAWRHVYSGLPIEDLIQEGNIGLILAVDKFDWRRGFRFTTMATWWIKQRIMRGIADTSLNIRLPVHMYDRMSRSRLAIESLERRSGRPATMLEKAEISGLRFDKFELAARATSEPMSIEEAECEGCIDITEPQTPFLLLSQRQEARLVEDILKRLTPREASVLRLRFGIGLSEAYTLEQVGAKFNVTRERIRQIESKALRALRKRSHVEQVAVLLGRSLSRPEEVSANENGKQKKASATGIGVDSENKAAAVSVEEKNRSTKSAYASEGAKFNMRNDTDDADRRWQLEFASVMSNKNSSQK